MHLSILTKQLRNETFARSIEIVREIGYTHVCLGTGGVAHTEHDHCYAQKLVEDAARIDEYKAVLRDNGVQIASFAMPANPVHPQKRIREKNDRDLRASILLAEKFGVDTVTTMSGCPGDHDGGLYPNWVCYGWPMDHSHVLKYQWEEVLIPYWKDLEKFARDHGVRVGLELHPNMCCYNTATMLRLREATGPNLGACLDPSHPFYLGMDPIQMVDALKDCLFAVHGKDTVFNQRNLALNGWFDGETEYAKKSWHFALPGYGHGEDFWKQLVFALRQAGYDRDICFEDEDQQFDGTEAMVKAYNYLNPIIYDKPSSGYYWAADCMKDIFAYLDDQDGALAEKERERGAK